MFNFCAEVYFQFLVVYLGMKFGLCGSSVFNLLRNCQVVFQCSYAFYFLPAVAEGSSVSELFLASWGVGPGCLAAGPWGPGVGVGLLISGDSSSHSWSYRILSLPKLMGGLGSQGGWLRGSGCPGSGAGLWRLD